MKTNKIYLLLIFNFLFFQSAISQKYIGIDVLSFFGDLKSIQLNYEIIKDSLNAFSFGPIINFKSKSKINLNDMDGRRINYNLRNGINGGLSFGYTRQIIKHLYLQNVIKIEYNKLNLSTYSATIRDSIGDVYYYSDFRKMEIDRNALALTNTFGMVFNINTEFFKLKLGPTININISSFDTRFPNNDIVNTLNKDSDTRTKYLSRYIFSYEEKFNVYPFFFLSMLIKIAD